MNFGKAEMEIAAGICVILFKMWGSDHLQRETLKDVK